MTIQGVEVEAVVIPIAGLSFSFNGAYTDTNIDKVQVPPIGGLTLTRSQITRYAPRFSSTVAANRSEEHTSELQSLMRISYAVFCLKKKKKHTYNHIEHNHQC